MILSYLLNAFRPRAVKSSNNHQVRLSLEQLEERSLLSIAPQAQLMLYEINRARSNPVGYQRETNLPVDLSSTPPSQPLAINDKLVASAQFHTDDMANRNYFGHQSPSGLWPNQMARNEGYNLPSWWPGNNNYIESIAAGYGPNGYGTASGVLYGLILDEGVPGAGHRVHLLAQNSFNRAHKEIGVGYTFRSASDYRNYWAIHTAYEQTSDLFLTGVVYNDVNSNGRYDLNEGLSGVTVAAGSFSTLTNNAGGWSLKVTPGSYTVTAQGGGFSGFTAVNTSIDTDNVEVDFPSGKPGQVNFAPATPVNSPPILDAIPDQAGNRGHNLVVALTASDPQDDPVTLTAQTYSLAYGLDQQLGLHSNGNYAFNLHRAREKYIRGAGNALFFLLPNGSFYRWTGSIAGSTLVARLPASYYVHPQGLWQAAASAVPVTLDLTGNQLTLAPDPDYAGSFLVKATASDGQASSSRWFTATITNHAPSLETLPDQSANTNGPPLNLTLAATDDDGDAVSFQAQAVSLAYAVEQQLGLNLTGGYNYNRRGAKEKYITGTAGTYFLLPNGELHRFTGTIAGSPLVATFSKPIYVNPALLWKAPPGSFPVALNVVGNQLTIQANGYIGSFVVKLTADDGLAQTVTWFDVTFINHPPEVQVVPTADPNIFNVAATDAEGDQVDLSARAVSYAYGLDQQLGLFFPGSFQYNARRAREKYLRGTDGLYFLLPTGQLYRFTTTIAASIFVAQLDPGFYVTPASLYNALPGTPPVTVDLTGNTLTVDRASFTDPFFIEITADDGTAQTKYYLGF